MCVCAGLTQCSTALVQCQQAGSGAHCECRGGYTVCITALECPQDLLDDIISACETTGCTPAEVRWLLCEAIFLECEWASSVRAGVG